MKGTDTSDQRPGAGRGGDGVVLAVLALAGLAIHGWFALGADALDTDRALVLLMARHFAQGHFSLYFWQQNYMGALEPLLLTPLAMAGWATPRAAAFVGVGVTAALAWLCVRMARPLGAARWMTLLLWAVPPALVVHHHVALYGARLVATLLVVAAWSWGLSAVGRKAWVGVGILLGLAYFGDHLMLPWAVGVLWVATRRGGLSATLAGALPLVVADTVAAVLTPAVHVSGPNDPGSWLANVPLLFGTTLPQLFGLLFSRGPTPVFQQPAPVVPTGELALPWLLTAVPGLLVLGALALTLYRRRRVLHGEAGEPAPTALESLALVVVSALGLLGLVGGGGDVWPARYLVPLWPAVSLLAGVAVAQWPRRLRPWAVVAVLPAVFTLFADPSWPRAGDGAPALEEAAQVAEAVEASGAQAIWTGYWDAYRMALLTGEDPPWLPLRIIERRPDLLKAASEASPVAYLVRPSDTEVLDVLARAPAQGIAVLESSEVGPFRLVVTQAPVPGAILRFPPPPRGWQMLAALGAGLLFLGTVPVVVGLARLAERRR